MFGNEDRHRYYGIRIGDTVTQYAFGTKRSGIVINYGMDNNQVTIEGKNGQISNVVAEWCEIEDKIEDKLKRNLNG